MIVDTILVTVPTIWDGNKTLKQNGEDIGVAALKEKEDIRKYLDLGFTVKLASPFVFNGVAYIHYVLERERVAEEGRA